MCAGQAMPDNNGNLKRQEVYVPDNDQVSSYHLLAQDYEYDSLNRLQRVHDGSNWQQQYSYDRYGNRTIDQANTFGTNIPKPSFTVNTANNRLGVPSGQTGTMSYDAAGNLTTDTYSGNGTRTYDAENRMVTATDGDDNTNEYTYDGDGHRVKRYVANDDAETWQVYGLGGELLAEYDAEDNDPSTPQKEYGYRNGQLLITAEPAPPCDPFGGGGGCGFTLTSPGIVHWLVTDQLGTPRMIFDQSGSLATTSRHDYLPFGEEIFAGTAGRTTTLGYTNGDGARQKFTLKERDIETGLDYFGARYYGSTQGRFTGADPISLGVDRLFDPQRFNRYAYVRNNPLMFTDPDGRDIVLGSGDQKKARQALVEIAKRPGGRELLQKMDKLTLTIMVTSGQVGQGRDAYGSTKGSFVVTKDSQGNLDAKNGPSGNGVVITLDFKSAEDKRKENKTIEQNNEAMKESGLKGKPIVVHP
jgi:RHS repeat-associated protein